MKKLVNSAIALLLKFKRFIDMVLYFYLLGTCNLWLGKKAKAGDCWGRCREVCADPANKFIPRVKDAGIVTNGSVVMHNGLRVKMGKFAYYGELGEIICTRNKGVHEPQEEMVFREVLKFIPENATMIELGSYWAFYSMWFKKEIKGCSCLMLEPVKENLLYGVENFRLNGMSGDFLEAAVGKSGISVDDLIRDRKLDTVHILHADIQGAELEMLESCMRSISQSRIWYFFISTHSQKLHYECLSFLEKHGYVIIASADFDYGTYCYDGVLAARLESVKGPGPIEISLRRKSVHIEHKN